MSQEKADQPTFAVHTVGRNTPELFPLREGQEARDVLMVELRKSAVEESRQASNAGESVGIKPHLINKLSARDLVDANPTHGICIDAKAASSVGLGHREREIHKVLNPLCSFHWQDVLNSLSWDYFETGECFLEVTKNDEGVVTGLYHLESAAVEVELEEEDNPELFHYVVNTPSSRSETIIMARFGDLEDLQKRATSIAGNGGDGSPEVDTTNANDGQARIRTSTLSGQVKDSEIIHIRQPNNRSRFYGYPDYMAAVASIELVQCMTQYEFDFYFNRGVPEFLLFLFGNNVGSAMSKLEEMFKANQGPGNQRKSQIISIPGNAETNKVQMEMLATEEAHNTGYSEKSLTLSMAIATAHGMPPALANILVPGKMAANNEGPNALLTFQKRKLGQAQLNFSSVFATTLGADGVKLNQPDSSPVELDAKLFTGENFKEPFDENGMPIHLTPGNGFNTILDGMSLGAMETLATMREPITGSDRDLSAGKLSGQDDRRPSDPRSRSPRPSPRPAS